MIDASTTRTSLLILTCRIHGTNPSSLQRPAPGARNGSGARHYARLAIFQRNTKPKSPNPKPQTRITKPKTRLPKHYFRDLKPGFRILDPIKKEFSIANLLVRIHLIIEMSRPALRHGSVNSLPQL